MPKISALPKTFSDLRLAVPDGYILSEAVVDPLLLVTREDGRIQVRLAGAWKERGQRVVKTAPTVEHCWVIDNQKIHPLPRDAPKKAAEVCGTSDPNNLTYSDAVKLLRTTQTILPAEADATFLTSANTSAQTFDGNLSIPGLTATLFPYQSRGVQWMLNSLHRNGGLILADEMGLGKTLQIIALLSISPPPKNSPALIICPTSLIANWVREFHRFAPDLTVQVHHGSNRPGVFKKLQEFNVVITTYDTMLSDISIISAFEWTWVICDEAQAIKNPDSNRRQAVASIPRIWSIPMTGTPVENSLLDLWSLADFSVPGVLGTRAQFENEFPDSIESAKKLTQLTNPIVLKRRVSEVAGDLPERIDIDLPLALDHNLIAPYRQVRDDAIAKYPVAGSLVATLQLQLFCAHPRLRKTLDDDAEGENAALSENEDLPFVTAKVERTIAILEEAFQNNQKVIIFALFNRIGDILRRAASDLQPAHWGAINGSTPSDSRQKIIDEYTAHQGPACLVLNPKAAGAGLNITAATIVIHFTPVWNPALEAQASARAHRRGQTRPVTIYRIFYKDTVEEVMVERALWKQRMGDEITPVSTRDADDLKKIFSLLPSNP